MTLGFSKFKISLPFLLGILPSVCWCGCQDTSTTRRITLGSKKRSFKGTSTVCLRTPLAGPIWRPTAIRCAPCTTSFLTWAPSRLSRATCPHCLEPGQCIQNPGASLMENIFEPNWQPALDWRHCLLFFYAAARQRRRAGKRSVTPPTAARSAHGQGGGC